MTDIRDAVSLSTARPMLRRFGGGAKWAHDSTGVVAVEQKGSNIGAARRECRLKHAIGDRLKRFDPFPTLVPVHFFEMIEIVLDANRVVVPTGTVDDDSTALGGTVE